jgi:hypothetical protein
MTKIKFYVIYSADWGPEDYNGHTNHEGHFVPWNTGDHFEPGDDKALWHETEDGESEWQEVGLTEHRKWVTLEPISREEFQEFIHKTCLAADTTPTMGSITDRGWLPAISFNGDTSSEVINAYVTPIVEDRVLNEDDWDRISQAVISVYGN